jgi:ABC-type uncharacterized transport system substrate-binding protein
MPMVHVVTPSSGASKGINALNNELVNVFNWTNLSWHVWSVVDDGVSLATCAANAANAKPDVIVTAGTAATNAVLAQTGAIPIIQAVGGAFAIHSPRPNECDRISN